MTDYTIIQWSDMARSGKEYSTRVRSGEHFAIWHNGDIIATLEPIGTRPVKINIEIGDNDNAEN